MTPAEISRIKGGEVFRFTYDYADVAQTFVLDANNWGLYLAEGVNVSDAVRPGIAEDGATSTPGTWTASVSLLHLEAFSTAHVVWEGTGFTVEYTLDGTTWLSLSQHGVVNLAGDPDFDIRVTFAGGIVDDPAELVRLTVYVLKTDTIKSTSDRVGTFTADAMTDEGLVLRGGILSATTTTDTPLIGTFEFWARVDSTGTIAVLLSAGGLWVSMFANGSLSESGATVYVDGVPFSGAANAYTTGFHHYVVALDAAPANVGFKMGADWDNTNPSNITVSHLATYPTKFSAAEALALYKAQSPTPIRVDDSGVITVTEATPSIQIYAYAWSVASG